MIAQNRYHVIGLGHVELIAFKWYQISYAVISSMVSSNCRALDVVLQFWCMDMDSVTVTGTFDMADRVVAFHLGVDDTYETTGIATQREGGTTSTGATCQYGQKGKQPRVKP
ncbi:hypothetical protein Syun_020932 [Stephania yunnanensis]|uniref:Uncharacterized protein n=1 Tax=Stephania yunnanensis TaxID=152371 RepID=A0AAP0IFD6_9MAGN